MNYYFEKYVLLCYVCINKELYLFNISISAYKSNFKKQIENSFCDMLLVFSVSRIQSNSAEASRVYAQRFLQRSILHPIRLPSSTGQMQEHRGEHVGASRPRQILQTEEDIFDLADKDPTTNTQAVCMQVMY